MHVQILPLRLTMKEDRTREHYRRFNNSVIHFRDHLYMMSYRLFLAPRSHQIKKTGGPVEARFHPWNSDWSSAVDQTILSLLRYHPESKTFEVLEEKPMSYFCPKDIPINDVVADGRLVVYQDKVYVHGNGWGVRHDELGAQKKDVKRTVSSCSRSGGTCELVVEMLMRLDSKPSASMPTSVHELIFPCLNNDFSYHSRHGDVVEKNWSFFEIKGRFYTEYLLAPHIVAKIDMKSPRKTCNHPVECDHIHRQNDTVFGRIAKAKGGGCFFSPGGSPIAFNEHEMINVGHVKYNYTEVTLLDVASHPGLRMHPSNYVYLMFIYTFSSQPPFELRRVTHSFIPVHKDNPYALVFAMGIAPLPHDDYVISYGEGDDTSNMLILPRARIEHMLLPVDSMTPDNYRFEWLQQ